MVVRLSLLVDWLRFTQEPTSVNLETLDVMWVRSKASEDIEMCSLSPVIRNAEGWVEYETLLLRYFKISRQTSLVAQLLKNLPAMKEALVWFLGWEDPLRRDRPPTLVFLGFPGGSDGKEFACKTGDLGSIPGLGTSPGGGHGNPLHYSCLENPMDRGAWQATVHGVTKRRSQLSD